MPTYAFLIVDDAWRDRVERTAAEPLLPREGNEPAMIWPTSGTTGAPSGSMQTHAQCPVRRGQHRENAGSHTEDRLFSALRLAFRAAGANCLSRLFGGGTTILFPTMFDPIEFVEGGRCHLPTTVLVDPVLVSKLNQVTSEPLPLLPDADLVMSSGGPLSAEDKRMARRHISPAFHDFYAAGIGGVISILGPEDIDTHA